MYYEMEKMIFWFFITTTDSHMTSYIAYICKFLLIFIKID